jgi:hypothetical protein
MPGIANDFSDVKQGPGRRRDSQDTLKEDFLLMFAGSQGSASFSLAAICLGARPQAGPRRADPFRVMARA